TVNPIAASSAPTVPMVTSPPGIRRRGATVSGPVLVTSSMVATTGCLSVSVRGDAPSGRDPPQSREPSYGPVRGGGTRTVGGRTPSVYPAGNASAPLPLGADLSGGGERRGGVDGEHREAVVRPGVQPVDRV